MILLGTGVAKLIDSKFENKVLIYKNCKNIELIFVIWIILNVVNYIYYSWLTIKKSEEIDISSTISQFSPRRIGTMLIIEPIRQFLSGFIGFYFVKYNTIHDAYFVILSIAIYIIPLICVGYGLTLCCLNSLKKIKLNGTKLNEYDNFIEGYLIADNNKYFIIRTKDKGKTYIKKENVDSIKYDMENIKWKFYKDNENNWRWEKLDEKDIKLDISNEGYITKKLCIKDAKMKGYNNIVL